jgi:hypothetical protein
VNLVPGTYSLRFEKKGCASFAQGVVVGPYTTRRFHVQLQPADASPEAKAGDKGVREKPIISVATERVPRSSGIDKAREPDARAASSQNATVVDWLLAAANLAQTIFAVES